MGLEGGRGLVQGRLVGLGLRVVPVSKPLDLGLRELCWCRRLRSAGLTAHAHLLLRSVDDVTADDVSDTASDL